MISTNALKFFDSLRLVLSGAFGLLAFFGAIYAVPWRRRSSEINTTKEYNKLWIVRLFLQITATAWLLCPYIELYDNWSSELDGSNLSDDEKHQRSICQSYVLIRLGFLEPFFLLLSHLTFSEYTAPSESTFPPLWLRRKNPTETSPFSTDGTSRTSKNIHKNRRIILTALAWTSLVLCIQSVIPILGATNHIEAESDPDEPGNTEGRSRFLRSSLLTYLKSDICWKEAMSTRKCEVCVIPFFSTLVSAVVIICYLWKMWEITMKMAQMALNQCLEQRMRLFRSIVTVLLLTSLLFRGLEVIWVPAHVFHEFCRFADFLSVLLFVNAFSFLLVIRPVREGRLAEKNSKNASALAPHR